MPWYEWMNTKTGKIRMLYRPHEDRNEPPDSDEGWQRRYTFGVGKVEGAGDSPARPG
jgi:hypothetical protein